ncbi:MAG TPA: hypothetical protein VEK57_25310 [Thermoanaerobaculia bacterium]|nr:hypothetical protein [Thermoanaerobaculia bacterium]
MRKTGLLLALLLVTAAPAFARLLHHGPHTARFSRSGIHLRESRYYPLVEGHLEVDANQQIVVYDSDQLFDPRVIYSSEIGDTIDWVAYYETETPATSMFLIQVSARTDWSKSKVFFSRNGGTNWSEVPALAGYAIAGEAIVGDLGGPWTKGPSYIRLGTRNIPFVLSGVDFATVDDEGNARILHNGVDPIAGQNRAGTKFLSGAHGLHLFGIGGEVTVLREVNFGSRKDYWGWIADDDTVYVLENQTFYRWREGQFVEIATGVSVAAPAHDFDGGWLVQRSDITGTKLLRYTPALGVQTMWTDSRAPKVGSIIAGASGSRLLLHVTRDQFYGAAAFALWQVGNQPPAEYDELRVRLHDDRTIVHVEVDALQAGAPFMFDTGSWVFSTEPFPVPPASAPGDIHQRMGVVRASLRQHLVLPGAARLPGAFGSLWRTDVTLSNAFHEAQTVEIRFVPLNESAGGSGTRTATVTLLAREIRLIDDSLGTLFGITEGGGTLHIVPEKEVDAIGRTYSVKDNGTYGFGMHGIELMTGAGARFPLTFAGAFPGAHFRTNVLLTDTTGRGTAATLNAYTGKIRDEGPTIAAASHSTVQHNGVESSLGLLSTEEGALLVQPVRGAAIATVVAIDNRTNDPSYFAPDLMVEQGEAKIIPVVGHVDGANGSRFRSDLYLFNASGVTRPVALKAIPWSLGAGIDRVIQLRPFESRHIVDVLPRLFGITGLAQIVTHNTVDSSYEDEGVRVTSRTYNVEPGGATYGTVIPPFNQYERANAGEILEVVVSGGSGVRVNLGLVGQGVVRIRLLDDRHRIHAMIPVTVDRGAQINDIFRANDVTPPDAAKIRIEVLEGTVGAYATINDNITNDPTYLAAQIRPEE